MGLYKLDVSDLNNFKIEEIKKKSEEIVFSGRNRRLPEGVFVTDEPLLIENGDFRGAGKDKTVIIADFPEKDKPILYLGSTPYVEGFTICYRDGLVNGEEATGERVGIYTTNYWPLSKGAGLRDIAIKNVGTGVLSDKRRNGKNCVAFSVFFDNISVTDFSYRGFDFISCVRTGNVYSSIKLSSGKYSCDSAFYFSFERSDEEESETDIISLEIYDTKAKQPIVLGGARALVAGRITLDNVEALDGNFVVWEKSSGRIENFEIRNSALPDNGRLFNIGSTKFLNFDTLNYIRIGSLELNNVFSSAQGFNLFYREAEYTYPYNIKVEEYKYSSETADSVLYEFPTEGNFNFIQKGKELLPSRLCPYHSKTKVADGRWLIWTGTAWQ